MTNGSPVHGKCICHFQRQRTDSYEAGSSSGKKGGGKGGGRIGLGPLKKKKHRLIDKWDWWHGGGGDVGDMAICKRGQYLSGKGGKGGKTGQR